MINFAIPVLGVVAYSGTGKTTLLERLIPCLTRQGVRVAAVKHSHHDFEIDKKGKDSDRLRHAGAGQVVLASQYRTALIIEEDRQTEPDLKQQLERLDHEKLDLVLVEGFRQFDIPKLEIHRPSLAKPLLCNTDSNVIALACDEIPAVEISIPVLPLNDEQEICTYIIENFITR